MKIAQTQRNYRPYHRVHRVPKIVELKWSLLGEYMKRDGNIYGYQSRKEKFAEKGPFSVHKNVFWKKIEVKYFANSRGSKSSSVFQIAGEKLYDFLLIINM